MVRFIYLDTDLVIRLHTIVIEKSGGSHGDINTGLLDSTLAHIQNDDYYPDFYSKLTHVLYSIIMNHSFIDGNKRTALATAACLITLNYNKVIAGSFIDIMEDIVVQVADGSMSKQSLHDFIVSFFETQEANESILVEIIREIY